MNADRPNILIVLADQLRRQALGCYGDPNVSTPHIDALAGEGAVFDAACSTYPVCVPFRFSFMTGQYAHTRYVPALSWRMSPAERTLADEFNANGYHTVYVGKWHLEGSDPSRPIPRSRQGRWEKWMGFELRNSHFDTFYFEDDDPTPRPLDAYQTDGLFDLTMRYLGEGRPAALDRGGDPARAGEPTDPRPFCCVLSVEPPHFPYEAPEEYEARWRGRDLVLPETFERRPDHYVPPSRCSGDETHTPEIKRERVRTYYAMIENLDDNVGRMMRFLSETGLDETTVVVFLSDHGEMGGMHTLPTAMKEYPFEESIGIPLIVRDPRRGGAGRRIAEPVCTEDLFPTLCGLVGITPRDPMPGADLGALIRGERDRLDRDGVLIEAVKEFRPPGAFFNRSFRGLRTRRWKYTVLADRDGVRPWQLFDLQGDPLEMHNLVNAPEHETQRRELHESLRRVLRESDDHFPLPSP